MTARFLVPLLAQMLYASAIFAGPMAPRDVPEPLKLWIPWVLHGQAARFCPPAHDNGGLRLCSWPSELQLELDGDGGRFELRATTRAPGWLGLPGDGPRWPQTVSLAGRNAPVLEREGFPALWLEAGEHRVQGRFAWKSLPESLRVPPSSGLIELTVNGRAVPHPQRDAQHQLWLGRRATAPEAQAERLGLRVFRLVDDDIPLTVTTQLQIDVGGEVREEVIGPALLPGLVPLSLSGDLPARLEDDGGLRVQLRPGLWTLTLVARSTAPLTALAAPPAQEHDHRRWAAQEIWSLRAHPELRVVEASGLPPIDPRQGGVPDQWQELPAFLADPGAVLKLNQSQRGSPDLAPDELQLQRQLWLDFDGGGFTVQDQLNGRLARTWRLEARAPIALGQVQVDGQPQLITRHLEGTGVEVRHGQLNLSADSRIENGVRRIPAGGWNTDLQGIQTTLHLPPAWRLLAAPGVDNVPDTWLARWSLLDLFLVLIAAIAALRLFGRGTAALTLLTLALTWHESGAPQWTWLNLIAAIALLSALPASFDGHRLRKLLLGYQWIAAAALAFVALPFAIQQARVSLYPQLENEYGLVAPAFDARKQLERNQAMPASAPMPAEMDAMQEMTDAASGVTAYAERKARRLVSKPADVSARASQSSIQKLDPRLLTQTGPGLPNWSWRQSQLSWSGPVTADQSFRLWLMPPWLTRTLGWTSIALIVLLASRWLRIPPRLPRLPRLGGGLRATALLGTMFAAGLATMTPAPAQAQAQDGIVPAPPTAQILDQLRERLSAPPDCLPNCASWSHLDIEIGGETLRLRLGAEAQIDTALPLPVPPLASGQDRVWQPNAVLLDEQAADLLRDDGGALWLRVPAGRHTVILSGELNGFSQLQIPLSPAPKLVESDTPGWLLTGVDAQGAPGSALNLVRERKEDTYSAVPETRSQSLPPLLRLTRTLQLGLVWNLESVLERIGSASGALLASLPALPGEVVTGDAVRKLGNNIQASFAPGQTQLNWTSRLDTAPTLALKASTDSALIEVWRFDVSPLWHIDFAGLPAVSHQQGEWRLSTFRPWPGEEASAQISRPAAVQGRVLTLDSAELLAQPGRRAADYTLNLLLRASQGGQHALPLPASLGVQSLTIDGQPQPARRENDRLVLPLHPGTQNVQLRLRADQGLGLLTKTPALSPGLPGVNARLAVQLPPDRWVLLVGGPALGPAVLFWGVLAVLLVVALALGRVGMTPLKGLQWSLLMIGLSQLPIWGAALVAGWLFALALRGRMPVTWSARRFNLAQALLALWTLAALSTLFGAVAQGLLGTPDMQIAGNGSSAQELRWYQDRYDPALPSAWVLSVSIWVYRGLMLLWALWLANSLLNWLRWGWTQYSAGGLWKKPPPVAHPAAQKSADNWGAPVGGEKS